MIRTTVLSLVVAGALAVAGAAAIVVADRTEPSRIAPEDIGEPVEAASLPILRSEAPPLDTAGWLNSEPLDGAALAGRVVLYDFWTFGCINCIHTIPHVQAWHDRYAADGLVVLSVHTPEFDYEKDPARIAEFLADNAITYPVALDPDRRVWRAFGNHWWPAFYLFDRDGAQRYFHKGEGRYQTTEATIRALLGVDPTSPWAEVAS